MLERASQLQTLAFLIEWNVCLTNLLQMSQVNHENVLRLPYRNFDLLLLYTHTKMNSVFNLIENLYTHE